MQQQRIWILTARKLSNEATQDERIELQELVNNNHNTRCTIESLSAAWNNKWIKEPALQPVEKLLKRLRICEENKL